MKKTQRILPLALAGVMAVGCLSGCGGSASSAASGTATSSSTAASEPASTGPVQAEYPLSTEGKTLTVYMRDSSNGIISDWTQVAGYKAAAERMGINIEFQIPALGSETDQFNMMIASGNYPDIILWDYNSTPMSLAEMVNAGVLIDMDEYIRQYAPNYLAMVNSREDFQREVTADNGHMLAMYALQDDAPISGGPTIRADLLKKYNLEVPTTVDDWTEVMTALKDDPNVSFPMTGGKSRDGSIRFELLLAAYRTSLGFCLDDAGEVVFGPATENFKQHLVKLNEWYTAGLLDPEFISDDGNSMNAKLTDGRSVCGPNLQLSYHIGNITKGARANNPEFEFVGCPWPVLNEGDTPEFFLDGGVYHSGKQAAITSACDDPVLATQFLDYFYSEEGENYLCWGIEGESYTVNADGTKSYTDKILNNPDGKNPQEAIMEYATPMYNFANKILTDAYVDIVTTLPEQKAARATWLNADPGVTMPRLTVATDVQSDYSMMMNDINTYVQEMYLKFITGQATVDKDWDTYVNTLNGMGLETAAGYMRDAYTAYQQR